MFAVPTYWFIAMLTLMVVVGVVREVFGGLPTYDPAHVDGAVPVHQGNGLVMGATILVVLRAFANGGSSLTGVEAISNTVNLFRNPAGRNARRVLTIMAWILGLLLAGVAWLAYVTHATPYSAGYPSMLSEIGRAVFGNGLIGNILYFMLQAASAAILYNGANTSFNGFPALGELRRRGQLLAAPADETWSPTGLLERHPAADGPRGRVVAGHRRLGQRARAVVRDGRLQRVLDGRLRNDQTPSDTPR